MLKIGEFSKLSQLSIKTLRYYEKERLLIPKYIDKNTSYRFYDTEQLITACMIKSYRQLDFSIKDIKRLLKASNPKLILSNKLDEIENEKKHLDLKYSIINHLLEDIDMKSNNYQVVIKEIKECIVFTSETILNKYSDIMEWIPSLGEKVIKLNPNLKCATPEYEFLEYLDDEYKETNIRVKHSQAVTSFAVESDEIKFETLKPCKVLSIYHKGSYDNINEAYAYILKYASDNNYEIIGHLRECYIDGIWNKENVEDWLTEIQLPIK